ncbi:hydrogenase expression/formation protein hype [Lucifera butyrica]|uniref:Hydrogenase expression/formation protein hype n=1 Tax=Lucifera butyrica TaxID=1351585 RepID=A0A498R1W6_9FIRM|nr:hydrogenase expression/formation protein HypE [Lucifera butyrica]VBB05454.1 hydrogenase expression/formation protein hype [Lucifera butyrica]
MKNVIQLAHGSGGKLSHELVSAVIQPILGNPVLDQMHDAAAVCIQNTRLAFTTDSFVVKPLFFTGGDIGKLAVCGTVNDLAMTGAVPLFLTLGLIIEEGFSLDELERILHSMARAAGEAGVQIAAGDTKVVEKGAADGIFINTAGIGAIMEGVHISPLNARPGQDIIINGFLGEHALAVMQDRHGLTFPASLNSDCAPLAGLVKEILTKVPEVAVLRDPTRGGLATALNEIALAAKVGMLIEEEALPVSTEVRAVCDILGFDPLYLANEGKMIVLSEHKNTENILTVLHNHPYGREARVIGKVTSQPAGQVGLRTAIGGIRLLDMLTGDQLPRIC